MKDIDIEEELEKIEASLLEDENFEEEEGVSDEVSDEDEKILRESKSRRQLLTGNFRRDRQLS